MNTIDYKIAQNYALQYQIVCLWWLSYSTKTFLYSRHQTQSANNSSFVFSSRYQFHTQTGLNTSTKLNLIKRVIQINSPLSNYLKEFRGCFKWYWMFTRETPYCNRYETPTWCQPPKTNTIYPPWKVKSRIGQDDRNENNSSC